MPFATSRGGARIFYEVHGQTTESTLPPVVLVQGLGLSSRFWFDIPERIASGAKPRKVIVLDNRGVGRSDAPRGPYRMALLADDVAAVLEAANLGKAVVVGISLGGMIAQHVALRHPDKVAGLVLLATTPGLPHGRLPEARALVTLLGLPIASRFRSPAAVGRSMAKLLLPKKDAPRVGTLLSKWPAAMRAEPVRPASFFSQLAAVATHSTGARLRHIACPTVVVTGDEDVLVPPHNSRLIASLVPGAHLEVVRDCGHAIPAIDPQCVERALERLGPQSA